MADQPRLLFPYQRRLESIGAIWFVDRSSDHVLLLARFFKLTRPISSPAVLPSRHFDPFGTEFSV